MDYCIVGFDPGVTSGVAIISLQGELLFSDSFRNLRLEDIAEAVAKVGHPLIVATDVSPPSDSAARLCRMFGATLYYPTISLTVVEKQGMTYGGGVSDVHQRDAFASAISAFRNYRPMIDKIRSKVGDKYGMVFEKLLKGEAPKIQDALVEKIKVVMPPKPSSTTAQIETLKLTREHLVEQVEFLSQSNQELSVELREVRHELERYKSDTYRSVAADKKVKSLQAQLQNIQKNDRLLFQRAKLAEGKLEAMEKWMASHQGLLVKVGKEGDGMRIGDFTLIEDVHDKLERLIKEHRKG
jgi:predicted RNase H-like nuclease (RuvC/YqgF family)